MTKKAAHFLFNSHLWNSPPNDALSKAYQELGYAVDFFAPDISQQPANQAKIKPTIYGLKWLAKNMFSRRWAQYDVFSCTSEDPIVIAGILSLLWRKPLIFLSDEIKAGAYRGDRPGYWKRLCRWAMRRASMIIVNDRVRIALQKDYAGLATEESIIVYPGCFLETPRPGDRKAMRTRWEVADGDLVLGFSGACNLTAGIDLALDSLDCFTNIHLVTQPLTLDQLNRYLLKNHRHSNRIAIQEKRMSWQESWSSMGGVDIGIAIYTNPAPQFQLMGISSNRLCMFLAMGVPVIVSKQPSFEFVEHYGCGVMIEDGEEFNAALGKISADLDTMKENALRCASEYINTEAHYRDMVTRLRGVLY